MGNKKQTKGQKKQAQGCASPATSGTAKQSLGLNNSVEGAGQNKAESETLSKLAKLFQGQHDELFTQLLGLVDTHGLQLSKLLKFFEDNASRKTAGYTAVIAALSRIAADHRIRADNPAPFDLAAELLGKHGLPACKDVPNRAGWKLYLIIEGLAFLSGANPR